MENIHPDAELHEESDIYFFTLSVEERNNLIAAGWRFEGVAWYAFS